MAANWSPKPKERVQFLHCVQLVLWCNWIARNTTDVLVWVRFLIGLQYGQFGRGGRWDCKSYGVGSIPTLTSNGVWSIKVMRRFVEPDKTGRYRPYTPTERWVSGLNQQFTKLPIVKGPWVRISLFPHNTRMAELGIRIRLRSGTIIGSSPITGTIFGKVNYLSYIYFIRLIGNKSSPLKRVSENLIRYYRLVKPIIKVIVHAPIFYFP